MSSKRNTSRSTSSQKRVTAKNGKKYNRGDVVQGRWAVRDSMGRFSTRANRSRRRSR